MIKKLLSLFRKRPAKADFHELLFLNSVEYYRENYKTAQRVYEATLRLSDDEELIEINRQKLELAQHEFEYVIRTAKNRGYKARPETNMRRSA